MGNLVVLSGAGISAESGLSTFRDSGGLWEGFNIEEVATIDGWYRDKRKVLEFYNVRREQAAAAKPNPAHIAIADLQDYFDVTVITQNVDDLHERAGSKKVIHLHGILKQARSENNPAIIKEIGSSKINVGDQAEDGSQLRPNIVWFGEAVPMMEAAAGIVPTADIFIVVGTSLAVYPAASLIDYVNPDTPKFIIDPSRPELFSYTDWQHLKESASTGIPKLVKKLIKEFK